MKQEILKTKQVVKVYQEHRVLDCVDITVNKGDIYALVGRNGAGKTTLMNIVSTLTLATEGSVYLFGQDINEARNSKNRMGCMIENPAFYPNLSAYDNLKYYCILKGIVDYKRIDEVLETVHLKDTKKKKFKQFSMGMKQRLGIALAILNHPDFIILDEPINGLDPLGISEIRETLLQLQAQNTTILISSHILSELYLVANKFGFLEDGKIIKELTKEQLDIECSKSLVIKVNDVKKACIVLEEKLKTKEYKIINDKEIRLYEYLETPMIVSKTMIENNVELLAIQETGISLEEYFKTIIKEAK